MSKKSPSGHLAKLLVSSFFILALIFSFVPNTHQVRAQDDGLEQGGDGLEQGDGTDNPSAGGSGSFNLDFTIPNPLAGVDSLPDFIKSLLNIVLMVGIPIIALFIIYAGFKFVVASGNEEKLQEAKKNLMYVLIGAAILLGSWVIAQAIGETVKCIGGATNC